jgi:hypothetical protein
MEAGRQPRGLIYMAATGVLIRYCFFGGLSVEETAEVLGISPETAKHSWKMARAWLFAELTGSKPPSNAQVVEVKERIDPAGG